MKIKNNITFYNPAIIFALISDSIKFHLKKNKLTILIFPSWSSSDHHSYKTFKSSFSYSQLIRSCSARHLSCSPFYSFFIALTSLYFIVAFRIIFFEN